MLAEFIPRGSNNTYLNQATTSLGFVQNVLLDTKTNIPQASIFVNASTINLDETCQRVPVNSSRIPGIWIEALVTLGSLDGVQAQEQL